jgi:hypothetical protein
MGQSRAFERLGAINSRFWPASMASVADPALPRMPAGITMTAQPPRIRGMSTKPVGLHLKKRLRLSHDRGPLQLFESSTRDETMKLFTAIYDDARLLGHFLRHYDRCGINEFFIAVSPACASVVGGFTNNYKISLFEGLDVAESVLGGITAVTEMRRMRQQDHECVVIVDLDEFVEFMPYILDIVSAAAR